MRVLVTGAAGFLGRNALLAIPASWEVVAIYRPGESGFLAFLADQGLRHVRPEACDLTDPAQVKAVAQRVGSAFDLGLYLASNTSIPAAIARPVDDLVTNVVGLLNALQTWRVGHLVYLSSGAVYLGFSGLVGPHTAVAPTLPYGLSKLTAERYLHAFVQYHGTPDAATIIRFFGAYGPHEPAHRLYTRLVKRFAFERNPRFTLLGDGENISDAMYVDDAIRALLAVLRAPAEGVRTVDLGVGGVETVNQVVTRTARAFGLEPRIIHEGTAPGYITFRIDPEPFFTLYGFRPTVSLEEGVRRVAAHLERERYVQDR